MESELICNYSKCRKRPKGFAWVTTCSHIFCDEDGIREFAKSPRVCPACKTSLMEKCDIIKMDLNPSEQYKSVILAGLNPETILEICSRGMSFWNYQINQEISYQAHQANRLTKRCSELEQICKQTTLKAKSQNDALKEEVEGAHKETENYKKRCSQLAEKLADKTRQQHRTQTMYENLRRKINFSTLNEKGVFQQTDRSYKRQSFEAPLVTVDGQPEFQRSIHTARFLTPQCIPSSSAHSQFTVRVPTPQRNDFSLPSNMLPK